MPKSVFVNYSKSVLWSKFVKHFKRKTERKRKKDRKSKRTKKEKERKFINPQMAFKSVETKYKDKGKTINLSLFTFITKEKNNARTKHEQL